MAATQACNFSLNEDYLGKLSPGFGWSGQKNGCSTKINSDYRTKMYKFTSCDVIFRARTFTAAMLVYYTVHLIGEKHFHRHYGEMQAANRPLFAY